MVQPGSGNVANHHPVHGSRNHSHLDFPKTGIQYFTVLPDTALFIPQQGHQTVKQVHHQAVNLAVLIRQLVLPLLPESLTPGKYFLLCPCLCEEIRQSRRHGPDGGIFLLQPLPQTKKRGRRFLPERIQFFHINMFSAAVHLLPRTAPPLPAANSKSQAVIFHAVAQLSLFRRHRQPALQIAEHTFIGKIPNHCLQRSPDQFHKRMLQNALFLIQKERNPIFLKLYRSLPAVALQISGDHSHIPVTQAFLPYQDFNAVGHKGDLLPGI